MMIAEEACCPIGRPRYPTVHPLDDLRVEREHYCAWLSASLSSWSWGRGVLAPKDISSDTVVEKELDERKLEASPDLG